MDGKKLTRNQIDEIYEQEVNRIDNRFNLESKVLGVIMAGGPFLGIGYSLYSGEAIYTNLGMSATILGMAGILASGFCALGRETVLRRALYDKQ